jgi:hypothetical protein
MTLSNSVAGTPTENEIDEKLNNISSRLSFIEGKFSIQSKSKIKKISDFGGLIALCISILIGGYTIYDKSVADPSRNFSAKQKSIEDQIAKLVSIRASISALDWNSDIIKAQNQANVWFPHQISILDKVQSFFDKYPDLARYENYMLLSRENENLNRNEPSLKYALMAIKLPISQLELANIRRATGRLGAKLGNADLMRTSYKKSIDGYKKLGSKPYGQSILDAYIEWIYYELTIPNCNAVRDLYSEYQLVLSANYIHPVTRTNSNKNFVNMKSSVLDDCNINFSNHISK